MRREPHHHSGSGCGGDADRAHAVCRDGMLEITMPVAMAKPGGRKLVIESLEAGKKSKEVH